MIGVSIRHAHLAYADKAVFTDLQFDLLPGQWTCLLGCSGVGKSTLLHLIAGLADAHCQADVEASDHKPLAGRVAYMAQKDLLLPWLNVVDNVVLGYRLRNQMSPALRQKAEALLSQVGLSAYLKAKPSALSGGMRQRVALARTLLEDCPVVLMDEPFSALDAVTRHRLQNLSAELLQDKTVLLVTHDPLEALRLGHRIQILAGSPAQVVKTIQLDETMPPRSLEDEAVLHLQAECLTAMAEGALS